MYFLFSPALIAFVVIGWLYLRDDLSLRRSNAAAQLAEPAAAQLAEPSTIDLTAGSPETLHGELPCISL
jgi:hypothetical protein